MFACRSVISNTRGLFNRLSNRIYKSRMGNFTSSPSGSFSNTASASFVQEVVSRNCIVIFSKTTCPSCRLAKNVFNEIGTPYKVPRVFVNGTCIGGGSETKELHQRGKLLPLVEQCAPCCEGSGMDDSSGAQPASYNL
ncbi:glutaredoxin-2, mitochondrial-like isoform X2 [Acipenser ruthenus]|uniref:glutaredoxin-2, mitochondrial-like isoform X2 n=1 Tax=Acipenser ruthenus TaxID=7906 RepID=UPI00145B1F9E|nr:glutaredoxin-2, mitochondrial-like isoform X2 [Acipenser ruthenus]